MPIANTYSISEVLDAVRYYFDKTGRQLTFEYSLVSFGDNGWHLEEVSVDYRREPHDEDAITEYEASFMALGQPIYRAIWKPSGGKQV